MRRKERLNIDPGPDMTRAKERWATIFKTLSARGFREPPFRDLIFGPQVEVDLDGDDPPAEAEAKTISELVERTLTQRQD